jgi:hypothetical protein
VKVYGVWLLDAETDAPAIVYTSSSGKSGG